MEGDSVYGLYTQLLQAAALGYVLVQPWKVEDSQVGGSTQRTRLFLIWAKKSIHDKLSQWNSTVCDPVGQLPAPISSSLLPVHQLSQSVWLQGEAVFDLDTSIRSHQATRVGFIKLKGALESLKVGDLVGRKTTTKGVNRWRVMSLQGS